MALQFTESDIVRHPDTRCPENGNRLAPGGDDEIWTASDFHEQATHHISHRVVPAGYPRGRQQPLVAKTALQYRLEDWDCRLRKAPHLRIVAEDRKRKLGFVNLQELPDNGRKAVRRNQCGKFGSNQPELRIVHEREVEATDNHAPDLTPRPGRLHSEPGV